MSCRRSSVVAAASANGRCTARHLAAMLAGLYLLLVGCTVPNPAFWVRVDCTADVIRTLDNKPTPSYGVTRSVSHSIPAAWVPIYQKYDPTYAVRFYSDRAFGLDSAYSRPAILTDAFLLQLMYEERTENDPTQYLTINMPRSDINRLWVAYDMRAYDASRPQPWAVPDWLSKDFSYANVVVYSTDRYQASAGSTNTRPVRYGVWRAKNLNTLLANNVLKLGGNNVTPVKWNPSIGDQYLLLVERVAQAGSTTKDIGDLVVQFEDERRFSLDNTIVKREMNKKLKDVWLKNQSAGVKQAYERGLVTHDADVSMCTPVTLGSLQMQTAAIHSARSAINGWEPQCEGEINSTSSSFVLTVQGEGTATIPVQGQVDFRVTADNRVEIGKLAMFGQSASLSQSGKTISNLSIGHASTFVAECDGAHPGEPFKLCDGYSIPVGAFDTAGFVTVDGYNFAARLRNQDPILVDIGYNRQTFSVTGSSLSGSVSIDGDTYAVTAQIDLHGTFDNLAPVAMLAEPIDYWECGDQGLATVTLQSMSFDEASPSDIVSELWFEHYGSATETQLGAGTSMTSQLPYGPHEITLEVTDSRGVSSTADFPLEIGDSRIDFWEAPPDQWLLQAGSGGLTTCVGEAHASDICGQVVISKDAPDCDVFAPGLSLVTWRFDDQNGNVVYHQQKIFVVSPPFFPPPKSALFASSTQVGAGQPVNLIHEVLGQGQGMRVDEYILIREPGGEVDSVDDTFTVRRGEIVPHRGDWTVGIGATSDTVYDGVFSDVFGDEAGSYRVEAILVAPGDDPMDPASILAWAAVDMEYLTE